MNKRLLAELSIFCSFFGLILVLILDSPLLIPNLISTFLFSFVTELEGFAYYWAWLFSLIGLILGIISLKSDKRKLAVIGIGVSIAGGVGYLVFFFLLGTKFGGI